MTSSSGNEDNPQFIQEGALAEIQARSLPKTCVKILILHNQDTLHSNLFSLGKLAESAPSCIIES